MFKTNEGQRLDAGFERMDRHWTVSTSWYLSRLGLTLTHFLKPCKEKNVKFPQKQLLLTWLIKKECGRWFLRQQFGEQSWDVGFTWMEDVEHANYWVCRRAVRSQIVSQFISKSSRQDSVSHPTRKWCGRYIQPRPVGRWSWQPAKELVQQPTNGLGLPSLAFLMGPDWLQSVLVGTFSAWSSRPIKFGLVDWLDEDVGTLFILEAR